MAWETSNRRERLPDNWAAIRRRIIRRDGGVCVAPLLDSGQRCGEYGTDVDHIIPGDNHDLSNLQLLCRWHHTRKTQRESAAARAMRPRPQANVPRVEREATPDPW
ncbi:HNH endonuclease signature motif containing protein [Streptomyces griseoincarnatus]